MRHALGTAATASVLCAEPAGRDRVREIGRNGYSVHGGGRPHSVCRCLFAQPVVRLVLREAGSFVRFKVFEHQAHVLRHRSRWRSSRGRDHGERQQRNDEGSGKLHPEDLQQSVGESYPGSRPSTSPPGAGVELVEHGGGGGGAGELGGRSGFPRLGGRVCNVSNASGCQ